MSKKDFDKAMFYLDEIEKCLNDIAVVVGHKSFDEFFDGSGVDV